MSLESHPRPDDVRDMGNDRALRAHMGWFRRVTNSEDTRKHRRDTIKRLAAALPVPLLEATSADLDRWQEQLHRRLGDDGASTVRTYSSHVRMFYKWLYDNDWIADDPAATLPMPKVPQRMPRPIPEKDLTLALRCATGDVYVWLVLSAWCGLRAGEISRLTGDSIHDEDSGMYLSVDGKGGKTRIVPVPASVAPVVRSASRRGPLFRRARGGAVSAQWVSRRSSLLFQSLGMNYVLHQCRHRFGTQFYRVSKDIRETQSILGHSNLSTTALYVAFSQERTAGHQDQLGASLPRKRDRDDPDAA